jgi:hypothetical protein
VIDLQLQLRVWSTRGLPIRPLPTGRPSSLRLAGVVMQITTNERCNLREANLHKHHAGKARFRTHKTQSGNLCVEPTLMARHRMRPPQVIPSATETADDTQIDPVSVYRRVRQIATLCPRGIPAFPYAITASHLGERRNQLRKLAIGGRQFVAPPT